MDKLKTIEKAVLEVLEDIPETREDDFILLLEVSKRTGAKITGRHFTDAMRHHKELKIPNWKSVERARRKIQAQRPDLISPEAAKKRRKAEDTYKEYSHS